MESIDSPCIDICMLDDDEICVGCQRTAHEIVNWIAMGASARTQVMRRLGYQLDSDAEIQC